MIVLDCIRYFPDISRNSLKVSLVNKKYLPGLTLYATSIGRDVTLAGFITGTSGRLFGGIISGRLMTQFRRQAIRVRKTLRSLSV